MKRFRTVAPGRLCLFGEHQDYLNLPVIALAIPLKATIEAAPHSSAAKERILELQVPQLDKTFRYDLDNLPPKQTSLENADFALASIHEAVEDGWVISCGATCVCSTDIVMQAGCSSSTAFTIAWILVLSKLAGVDVVSSPAKLAQLAYKAEVLHFGAPGGTMDHVSIAWGNSCLRIGPAMWEVQRLNELGPRDGVWILADSGDVKDTFGHLKRCKSDRLALLAEMGGSWDNSVEGLGFDDEKLALLRATLTNRDCEAEAAELWGTASQFGGIGERLGGLMLRHHEALRDGLKLSTPKLEAMREAALKTGAWGYKLVGSGGGGCAVAWTSKETADAVARAIIAAGARSTWTIIKPSRGACIEECS